MQSKSIYIFILLLSQVAFSQNAKIKKAHRLYSAKSYVKAAELYEQVPASDSVYLNIGDCYYYNGFLNKSAKKYAKALDYETFPKESDIYFKYAHSLYGINDITTADSIMSLYKSKKVNTPKLIGNLKIGSPYKYKVSPIKSGTKPGDFSLTYFGNKVSFTSIGKKKSNIYKWNDKPYLDIFTADYTSDGKLENIEELPKVINTSTHESNAVLTNDGNTLYFSRTNFKRNKINKEKIATVKIFKAEKVNGEWAKVTELPFSSDTYSIQHPALNEDETRLFFASDMEGSYGSYDIYYVDIIPGGFGKPVNLGPKINSEHREQFPFISKKNTLYFASNGLKGLGGLDIFMSEYNDEDDTWNTPLNLGEEINTGRDDFSFIVNSDDNTGFLSSSRSGSDNIYTFIREENNRNFIVQGTVKDTNSKELLPNTMITLFDSNDIAVDSFLVGEDARYKFYTKPFSTYKIEGFKPLYIPSSIGFNTDDSGIIELDIELEIESYDDAEDIVFEKDGYVYIQLENIYFELDRWNIKPQAAKTLDVLIDLMKKYPRMEVQLGAHTDTRSSYDYNLTLSDNRAKSAMEYIISKGIKKSRLTAKGYGETQLLVDCGDNCTEAEHSINRRCEFIITK